MKKQEQIEEMTSIMNGCFNTRSAAIALYNAEYQKADEVRKETAEKFAEKLKEKIDNQQYILLPTATVKYMTDEIAKEIISEYGVGVEK